MNSTLAPTAGRTDMPAAADVAANLATLTDAAVQAVKVWDAATTEAVDVARGDVLAKQGPAAILAVHAAQAAGVSGVAIATASGIRRSTLAPIFAASGHVAAVVKDDPKALSTPAKARKVAGDAVRAVRQAQAEKAAKRSEREKSPRTGGVKVVKVTSWDDVTEYLTLLTKQTETLGRGDKGRAETVKAARLLVSRLG